MKANSFQSILRKFPLKWNFFFFLGMILLVAFIQKTLDEQSDDDSFYILKNILLRLVIVCGIVVMVYSLVTSLAAYSFFIFLRKKRKIFSLQTIDSKLYLVHNLPLITFPLGGSIKAMVATHERYYSERFRIAFYNKKISIPFPHIESYSLQGIHMYFEDALALFRWHIEEPLEAQWVQDDFFTTYQKHDTKPTKTMDDVNRQEKIITSPGEWLQQKSFEQGDDVRRIIWKIYAKNKTLQVKTQEQKSPYAQQIELYIDWSSDIDLLLEKNKWSSELADYYKSYAMQLVEDYIAQGYTIRVHSGSFVFDDITSIRRMIINATWVPYEAAALQSLPHKTVLTHSLAAHSFLTSLADYNMTNVVICRLEDPMNRSNSSLLSKIFLQQEDEWQDVKSRFTLARLHNIKQEKNALIENIERS